MAEVCYSKEYRTKAARKRYTSGSLGRSGTSKSLPGPHTMCFLSGSKQQGHVPNGSLLPRETHLSVRIWGFCGGWFSQAHPAGSQLRQLKLRTPVMKPGACRQSWYLCKAALTNWYSMVHCSRCTPQNHQSISDVKNILRSMFPGLGQGSFMVSVSHRAVRAKQPDLLG